MCVPRAGLAAYVSRQLRASMAVEYKLTVLVHKHVASLLLEQLMSVDHNVNIHPSRLINIHNSLMRARKLPNILFNIPAFSFDRSRHANFTPEITWTDRVMHGRGVQADGAYTQTPCQCSA
jgi:hypothetical protein